MTDVDGTLGIYVDLEYQVRDGARGPRIWTTRAFMLFACEVGRHFDGTVLLGRTSRTAPPGPFELPGHVRLVELPHYANLRSLGTLARVAVRTARGMWRGLDGVATVWIFGPTPFSLVLTAIALLRRRRVVLGVRQNSLEYYSSRLPSRRWLPALAPIWLLDRSSLLLGRRLRTTVVGSELLRRHGGPSPTVRAMTILLTRDEDVAPGPVERDWDGPLELLTVGRIDPEKNPMLLLDALAELERRRPGRYRLTWVGIGGMEDAVRARAAELGLTEVITFAGFVPFGPELLARYRSAHLLLHVSLTEGLPQVLLEAMACALPMVATEVGGVGPALEGGAAGVLVPPSDRDALVRAVERLVDDPALRLRTVSRGLEIARTVTLDAEAARVARFVAGLD